MRKLQKREQSNKQKRATKPSKNNQANLKRMVYSKWLCMVSLVRYLNILNSTRFLATVTARCIQLFYSLYLISTDFHCVCLFSDTQLNPMQIMLICRQPDFITQHSKINFFTENGVEMVIRSWQGAGVVSKNFSSYI